jgi:hypothetical protein
MNDCGSFQVYVGAEVKYSNVDKAQATTEFWALSSRYQNKAVFLAEIKVLASNSAGQTAIQQQRKV